MKKYNLRKNYFVRNNPEIAGKLAFKTKDTDWVDTGEPVIIPISIHSHFHSGLEGEMKMEALMSIIKQSVHGKITVLMTELAHLHVLSIKNEDAFVRVKREAAQLGNQFSDFFSDCSLVDWENYIQGDHYYLEARREVSEKYSSDSNFKQCLEYDALSTYTGERMIEYPDKDLYLNKAVKDLLEQCTCIKVLGKKGYGFQFYPGKQYTSVEYINQDKVKLIDVFLTIEKKQLLNRDFRFQEAHSLQKV